MTKEAWAIKRKWTGELDISNLFHSSLACKESIEFRGIADYYKPVKVYISETDPRKAKG